VTERDRILWSMAPVELEMYCADGDRLPHKLLEHRLFAYQQQQAAALQNEAERIWKGRRT
jgi:hypothetical protein